MFFASSLHVYCAQGRGLSPTSQVLSKKLCYGELCSSLLCSSRVMSNQHLRYELWYLTYAETKLCLFSAVAEEEIIGRDVILNKHPRGDSQNSNWSIHTLRILVYYTTKHITMKYYHSISYKFPHFSAIREVILFLQLQYFGPFHAFGPDCIFKQQFIM